MDIKEILELGVLIEPDAIDSLKSLNEEEINTVIEKIKEERPLVVSNEILRKYLIKTDLKILKTTHSPEKLTVSDITSMLNERYNTLKEMLLKKIELKNAVSINKASPGDVTVIGMVKDIDIKDDKTSIGLEDPTGSIKCSCPSSLVSKLDLDDVVSFSGKVKNNTLFVEEMSLPDVPIRDPVYSNNDIRVSFIVDFNEKIKTEADFLFVKNYEKIEDIQKNFPETKIFPIFNEKITSPSLLKIGEIVILILDDIDPLDAIKKRYIATDHTDFIIDPIPDIIFVNKEMNMNYKSITILGNNVKINLKNREIEQINI